MHRDVTTQFGQELFRTNLNLPQLDGVPCTKCGVVPQITKEKINRKWIVDRSGRIDCDSGEKKEKLETYHVACWKELAGAHEKITP